jgi:hypothetical protein
VWTIDGVNIEAQTYLSTVTDAKGSWSGEARSYGQAYTNPVILGQVMSENDALWSAFWCRGGSTNSPPSATTLFTGKMVAEDSETVRADETIGIIIIEESSGTIGGVEFEAALGNDIVRSPDNSPPYTYNFAAPFATAPEISVTSMAAMDGNNGGWAYSSYGATPTSTTSLFLSVDEDQISDNERRHNTEQVGYIVFETSVVIP